MLDSLMLPMNVMRMARNHRFISSFFLIFYIISIFLKVLNLFFEVFIITFALVFT